MRKRLLAALSIVALSFTLSGAVLADSDPSVHQIYEAAASGQLVRAQEMMDEVLRDHPTSSKAHFVQSELYARQGKLAEARSELGRAAKLWATTNPQDVVGQVADRSWLPVGDLPHQGSCRGR